jgi:hypothetical protein
MPHSKRPLLSKPATIAAAVATLVAAAPASADPPASIPDIEGMWTAALESIEVHDSESTGPQTWYVSVTNRDGKVVDAPISLLARAHLTRVQLMPVSQAPKNLPPPSPKMTYMIYGIGDAFQRDDGHYNVQYDAYCGEACAKERVLEMSHDKAGWHYIASALNAVE